MQIWLGNNLEPTKLGYDLHKTKQGCVLKPHRMDQDAAPESLFTIIRCNCTGKCDKNTCSCKRNWFQCTLAYCKCIGTICMIRQGYDSCDNDDWIQFIPMWFFEINGHLRQALRNFVPMQHHKFTIPTLLQCWLMGYSYHRLPFNFLLDSSEANVGVQIDQNGMIWYDTGNVHMNGHPYR